MYAAGDAGVVELTSKIMDKEGMRGLLRGWSAAYIRLGKLKIRSRRFSAPAFSSWLSGRDICE